jgi:hypothetical protein
MGGSGVGDLHGVSDDTLDDSAISSGLVLPCCGRRGRIASSRRRISSGFGLQCVLGRGWLGAVRQTWVVVVVVRNSVDDVDDAGAPSGNQIVCLEWAWLGSAWPRPRRSLGRFGWALLRLAPYRVVMPLSLRNGRLHPYLDDDLVCDIGMPEPRQYWRV